MSSDWVCERHGPVPPLHVRPAVGPEHLHDVAGSARVPVWTPQPMPSRWLLSGLATAGDERTGVRATAVACSGPSPLGGPADLLLVAEEPGVGLGARYAGATVDAGYCAQGAPDAKVYAAGHPTALWRCPSAPDRVALVGEALGVWLWVILWPPAAELMLVEHVLLNDLRDGQHPLPEVGALTGRLAS